MTGEINAELCLHSLNIGSRK